MTTFTNYKGKNYLLVSCTDFVTRTDVVSNGSRSLETKTFKTHEVKNLKLSIHKGKLFVVSTYQLGDRTSRFNFVAHRAGLITNMVHPDNIKNINDFLDHHFPEATVTPLTEMEEHYIEELRFYDNSMTDKQKREVVDVVLKMVHMAFPVYVNFVDNRLSDGYYSYNVSDFSPQSFHRAATYREMVTDIFGVYRKDLAKAVLGCTNNTLLWASNFREILDIEAIIEVLKDAPRMSDGIRKNMELLRDFPKNTITHLFRNGFSPEVDDVMVEDGLSMASHIPFSERKLCKTWKELHDRGMVNYSPSEDGVKEINHPAGFEKFFQEASFDDLKVVPLRTSYEFIQTGKDMSVCVGSMGYIMRAFDGQGYCFRLDTKDSPYALVEVQRREDSHHWKINQVKGIRNIDLPSELNLKLNNELSKFIPLESRT